MTAYNPLEKQHLAEQVARVLLEQPRQRLASLEPFEGAGVYVIYYSGPFPPYSDVVRREQPIIYVGKAVPAGGRKGRVGLDEPAGQALFARLMEHAESIRQAENLDIDHFECRYLVVDDIWIPLAESLLIQIYGPIWIQEISGFGNHDPGSGRHQQQRSAWDTLHPGRPWAARLQPNRKEAELIERYGPGRR